MPKDLREQLVKMIEDRVDEKEKVIQMEGGAERMYPPRFSWEMDDVSLYQMILNYLREGEESE